MDWVSIADLARNAFVHEAAGGASAIEGSIKALPNVANPAQPESVAVGEAEYGIRRDGSVELTAAGVRELTDKYLLTDKGSIDLTVVFLDRDITFIVENEAAAGG